MSTVINYIGQPVSLLFMWMIVMPLYVLLLWAMRYPVEPEVPAPTGLLLWAREPLPEPSPLPMPVPTGYEPQGRPTPYPRPAVAIAAPPLSLADRYQAEQDQQYAEAMAAIERLATLP